MSKSPVRVLLLAAWLAAWPLSAAPVLSNHPFEALAEAEALIVGRVVRIDKGREVHPPEGRQWQHPVFEHLAAVEMLRFYAADEAQAEQLAGRGSVPIAYHAENPLGQGGVLSGPLWPEIRESEVRLFALRRSEDGAHRLWAEEGFGAVPPAFDTLASPSPVAGSLEFVQREVANALASGEPAVVCEAARYLSQALPPRFGSEPDPLPAFLDRLAEMLAGDIHRTEEAAAALLAAQGIPRPTVADLAEGRFQEQDVRHPVHSLIAWTLQQLPPKDRDRRLIETLLRNLAVSPWGAAMTLKELVGNPEFEAPLSAAIAEHRPAVLFVAEALIREGRQDLISKAMAVVRDDLDEPDQPEIDWQAGSRLLWKYGSAEDFERLVALAVRARGTDSALYSKLWRAADYDPGPTSTSWLRFVATYLADARPAQGSLRYGDLALGALSRHQADRFGLDLRLTLDEIPLADRNAAIDRAARWLAQQLEAAP